MKRFQKVTTMLCSVQATLLIATTNVLAKNAADQYLDPQWNHGKAPKNIDEVWNTIFKILQGLVTGVTGVMTIIMVGIFFYRCFKLASVSDNPKDRQEAIGGILQTLIGAALFGGTSLFMGLAFGLFK